MRKQKFLAALLAFVMILSMVPAVQITGFAAEGDTAKPVITWARTVEIKDTAATYRQNNPNFVDPSATLVVGINYHISNNNWTPTWDWNTVSGLEAPVTESAMVWDYKTTNQYGSDILKNSDAIGATWCNWIDRGTNTRWTNDKSRYGGYENMGNPQTATARKFVGTFTWPVGFDSKDIVQMVSTNNANYANITDPNYAGKTVVPINDDMFVFIRKADTELTNENYMDYLVFWSGTSNQNRALSYGKGDGNDKPGVLAWQVSRNNTALFNQLSHTDGWYTYADTNGFSTVLANNYKGGEAVKAGDNMVLEIYCFDYDGDGGMDKPELVLTKAPDRSAPITINYYLDAVTEAGFLGSSTVNGIDIGSEYYVQNGTDEAQLNRYKVAAANRADDVVSDGVQQDAPHLVVEGENVINVIYTRQNNMSPVSFVIDYAKDVTFTQNQIFPTALTGYNTYSLGGDEDGDNSVDGTYGTMTLNSASRADLTYSLTKFMSGIDNFALKIAHKETVNATETANWTKQVNVIPANNVYYEDDFATTDENGDATGIVGIEYGGDWNVVYDNKGTDDKPNGYVENTETANGAVQGWETSLANDTTFSDNAAHVAGAGATATFTFTGTGVDIYSYTDMTTGIVTAVLTGSNNGTNTTKYLMVDNLAVSGKYYQIPTLSFSGLEYGEYTVTLVVNKTNGVDGNGERSTYYLDGLRVYNPILESDDTVKNAYGESELNAVFTEVRDLLANTEGNETGNAVFIDKTEDGKTGVTKKYDETEYGTYGPKNEVYLAKDQSITFKVDGNSSNYYQIGLKAPNGATTAEFSKDAETNNTAEIGHSTDLYYKVTPVDGKITITNTGDNLLSVTKIKTTGATADTTGLMLLSMTEEEAAAEVSAFSLRSTVAYNAAPEEEVPVEPSEPEVPDIDVDIDNPTEPEQKPVQKPAQIGGMAKLVSTLFKMISGWFGR